MSSRVSVSFSLFEYVFPLFLSPFSFCLCVCVTRTHTLCTRRFNMASHVLVARYPYAANGNGRISFCAVVCIDNAVHSPLYAGCVLAGIFSLLVSLRIS